MALEAWDNAGDEPTRLAHLDDRHDRTVLLQGRAGPTQIVELLCHGTLHRRCFQRRWCHLATVCPIASRSAKPTKGRRPAAPSPSGTGGMAGFALMRVSRTWMGYPRL